MRENDSVSPDDLAGHAALLDRWFAAFNDHDVNALCELADDDVEVMPLGDAETSPPGTSYHGHEGLRTLMNAAFRRFPRLRARHSQPRPLGTQVTVEIEFTLDDGIAPARVRNAVCSYRICDGRIRRMRASEQAATPDPRRRRTRVDNLSPREREILSMLAGGNTVAEIASALHLSPFTVRTHIRNAKDKLQARTTAHAIAIALDEHALDV
jgi:DNA-binding CsgD family transcriptional regulator/ketosteroid isomerase-like protein